MSHQRRLRRVIAPAAACLYVATVPVYAADADETVDAAATSPASSASSAALDTVQVTGKKQPYRNLTATGATKTDALLKDLPQSVRVLTADLLEDAGVTNLAGALDLSSGVSRQSNLGGLWDSYAMRGFTGDPSFGSDYLVNGFNYSRGYNGVRDSANTATVEILKGPSAALYGRGEPGGTVNITTKKPLFEREGQVDISYGSFDAFRTAIDLTGPITDRVAYRLNGAYEKAGSYRDHVSSERSMMSPSFIWMLSDDTTISYEMEVSRQKATFDRGVVAINGRVSSALSTSRFYGNPEDNDHDTETVGHQVFVQHYLNDTWQLQGGFSYRESSIKGTSTEVRDYRTGSTTELRMQHRSRDNEATDLSARAELLGSFMTGPLKHNVLFGVDAYQFTDERLQYRIGDAGTYNVYDPAASYGTINMGFTAANRNTDTKEEQASRSIYAQDQIDLSEKWKLLLGVRFDDYDQKLTNNINGRVVKKSLTATSPRAGLVFQPNKQVSLYAQAGKTFRPNGGVSRDFTAFDPEEGRAYELGAKWDSADQRVTSTLALFHITKENVLSPDPIDPNNYYVTTGEAESKGLELDLSGEVWPTVRLSLAYAYTKTEVTKDYSSVLQGRELANVPLHSGNIMLVKSLTLNGNPASVGIGVNYVGEREGAVAPTTESENFKLPSYTTVKLTGSYNFDKRTKLMLEVDNLFDKEYYTSSYSQYWVYPGSPRAFKATLQHRF
ncbi:TonB-dependent siderophore receptor [Azoarcus indigens]|uniref:Iron complex outermembrane receptor protein n=1 Tax=Azoarcus indigens TaxID=29545 RepID=A0A4R6DPJ3_9RHOO|nr:TonB-dependent siderophore receptor [Azoarcus indigens]NMG67301.1 TonB-dependent siderophore receptor [Azoarcus indigens]TDN46935.1 iron complex outermembrane receptor protein [Azoarcus indigens]